MIRTTTILLSTLLLCTVSGCESGGSSKPKGITAATFDAISLPTTVEEIEKITGIPVWYFVSAWGGIGYAYFVDTRNPTKAGYLTAVVDIGFEKQKGDRVCAFVVEIIDTTKTPHVFLFDESKTLPDCNYRYP